MRLILCSIALGLTIITSSCAKPTQQARQAQNTRLLQTHRAPRKNISNRIFKFPENHLREGNSNAQVSIVMFVNHFCANCFRAHRALHSLLKDTALETSINIHYRHLPRTQKGVKAAKIALAAGFQGSKHYWAMTEKLFEQDGEVSDSDYLNLAAQVHVDSARLAHDLVTRESELIQTLQRDRAMAQFINRHGRKTGIFIDGYYFNGDISLNNLKNAIKTVQSLKKRPNQPKIIEIPSV